MSLKDRLLGRYTEGGYTVSAKRWWDRTDREAARLAAKVLAHERDQTLDAAIRRLREARGR